MRILLDESVPERLGPLLVGHVWDSVRKRGWAGFKNGKLLATAAAEFDVLLTGDKNMEFQQNLVKLPLAIVVMLAHSNRVDDLARLVPAVLLVLNHLKPCTLQKVTA